VSPQWARVGRRQETAMGTSTRPVGGEQPTCPYLDLAKGANLYPLFSFTYIAWSSARSIFYDIAKKNDDAYNSRFSYEQGNVHCTRKTSMHRICRAWRGDIDLQLCKHHQSHFVRIEIVNTIHAMIHRSGIIQGITHCHGWICRMHIGAL
jgi:hypothetical protein